MKNNLRKFIRKFLAESFIEEEYPASFNIEHFKSLENFKDRISYCEEHLQRLGSGSARIVYKIDDEKVLKLAKNSKGISQNNVEIEWGSEPYFNNILAQTIDSHPEGLWVEMELARPINKHEFKRLSGFDINVVGMYLKNWDQEKNGRRRFFHIEDEVLDKLDSSHFIYRIKEFIDNADIQAGDFGVASSYGVVKSDGKDRLVIIDYGLTNDVYSSHYSKPSRRMASMRESNKIESNLNDNFSKWFSGSKVVDANGNPQIVHHGTSKKFSKFNLKNAPQPIIWFTSNKSAVEAGEVGAAGRGHVMDLYALIKNPAGWKEYEKYGLGQLKGLGYDGAILPDPDGTFTGFVFEPNQLKSVKNKGEWNLNDKNIFKEENDNVKINKYVYHGTSRGAAYRMQREGSMRPGQASGSPNAPLSFSNTEQYASTYASRKDSSGGVLLRVNKTPDMKVATNVSNENGYVEYYTLNEIPSQQIEIKSGNKWIPISEFSFINEVRMLVRQTLNKSSSIINEDLISEDYESIKQIRNLANNSLVFAGAANIDYTLRQLKEGLKLHFYPVRLIDIYQENSKNYSSLNDFIINSNILIQFIPSQNKNKIGSYTWINDIEYDKTRSRSIYLYYDAVELGMDLDKKLKDYNKLDAKDIYFTFWYKFASTLEHELQHAYDDYRSNSNIFRTKKAQRFDTKYATSEEPSDEISAGYKYKEYLNLQHEIWARFTQAIGKTRFSTIDFKETLDNKSYIINKMHPLADVIKNFRYEFSGWQVLPEKMKKKLIAKVAQFWHKEKDALPEKNKKEIENLKNRETQLSENRTPGEKKYTINHSSDLIKTSDKMVEDGYVVKVASKRNDINEIRNGKSETKTVYHGTSLKNVDKIKKHGLQAGSMGYDSAGWYMVSTDFESALFHGVAVKDNDDVPVIEFEVPTDNVKWEGYPYFWPPFERNKSSKWFALKQPIPIKFIKKIHYVSYADFLKQKNEKF